MAYNSLFLWYREVVHILRVLVITSDRRCFDKTGNRFTHLVWKILQKYVSWSSKTISPSCDPCRASVKTPVQPGSGAGPQIAVYYGWWPIKYDTLKQWCFHCSNVSCFLGSAIALQVSLPARVCLCVAHRGKCQRICRIEAHPPCIPTATRRTSVQCWTSVATLAQHCTGIGWTSCACRASLQPWGILLGLWCNSPRSHANRFLAGQKSRQDEN